MFFFFLYFNCRAQAFWHFWKHPHALCWNWSQSQHTAIQLRVQFDISMLFNTWKEKNNSSTTSLVQHHAQPVEDSCMFNAHGRIVGYLSSAVFCTEMVYLPVWIYKYVSIYGPCCSLQFTISSVYLSAMRTIQHAQSTLLPTMLYTHNCTGIINPLGKGSNMRRRGK